jgi:glycosyltransferase involved in cell wall biosynthesis
MRTYNSRKDIQTNCALFGAVLIFFGFSLYLLSVFMGFLRRMASPFILYDKESIITLLWYSGLPIVIGVFLLFVDLFFKVDKKRKRKKSSYKKIKKNDITVVLTAYNDEKSIGLAVNDFKQSKFVKRVIVISNNSSDNTETIAKNNGAIVFNETKQGYGSCVLRALNEGLKFNDSEIICLCEGDMTFRAKDLEKLISYIDHGDMVNGTRIVEQLQEPNTQITMFMHYGNLAVAKLLEFKYLGSTTLTDVGTTYKIIRKSALKKIITKLNSDINLDFNPYFLERCILNGLGIIECPITFYPRVGESKGGNKSNFEAFKLGSKMIFRIIFGWK